MLQKIQPFLLPREKRLSALAFILGFLWDTLTLQSIDRLYDNLVLAGYLVVAFAAIVLINAHGIHTFQSRLALRGVGFAQFFLPFAFGGLFSGLLIFYSRSGPVLASAPFLLILALLFFGNELFKRHYARFTFQLSVFFVTLLSYAALIIPVLAGRMGGGVFVLSGLTALLVFFLALRALSLVAKEEVQKRRALLYTLAGIIFFAFNFLYFNNMIPPVPLSLKDIGIYHSLERERSGAYRAAFEPAPRYAFGRSTSAVFHRQEGESVYAWSSIFAPAKLDTDAVHRWSYFDERASEWVSASVVNFPISGGRREGYRGYSVKENVTAGKWRVDVETLRGQLIGRFVFTVEAASSTPALEEAVR